MKKEFFSVKAKEKMGNIILEASGREVFFVGSFGHENTTVHEVRVVARGNDYSVPAVLDSAKSGEVVIHNHPSGNLNPSDQDLKMASIFGNNGVGFYIVDNDVSKTYVVVEPFSEKEEKLLDIGELKKILLPEGEIAEEMGDGYELREEQLAMTEAVASAFNREEISLIEAGTGTGKTLSYLIPSVHWALANDERIVVSTNTINLQEQLIQKDIPLVRNALDKKFKYSLVKGMGNYLCLLRADTVTEGLFEIAEEDEIDPLGDILEWAKTTKDGSLSDLSFSPPSDVWDKVAAESDSCLRARCPYYSKCFFYKSRREVASSQIVVVNHHLLFSDLSIKAATDQTDIGILPPYSRIIFDEAHHMTDAATSHFGMRATKYGIIRVLRRLKKKGKSGEMKGLIFYTAVLASKLVKHFRKGTVNNVLGKVEQIISPKVDEVEMFIREAFDDVYDFSLPISQEKEGIKAEVNLRVTEEVFVREGWEHVDRKFSILRIKLKELYEEIRTFIEILVDYEEEDDIAKVIVEFRGVANKLDFYSDVIGSFLSIEDDGYVRWIEGRKWRGGIASGVGLSPLDISPVLKDRLYSKCKTVVMTSATMAVRGRFGFLKSELGLEDNERVREVILPSSFDYRKQLLLTIPDDIPEPARRGYSTAISSLISDAVKTSRGNALVLFTSYYLLESVYGKVRTELEEGGILCLRQGSIPRARLLDKFRTEKGSVLFATDSFWEGVDVPGDALRLVIITRLPFRVPTEPVLEAKVEYLESQGINSFIEYSLPVAVLKFKQGFGRLIRTKTDKGAVLVLDKRIVSKSYGRYFLESLPDCRKVVGGTKDIISELEYFFKTGE